MSILKSFFTLKGLKNNKQKECNICYERKVVKRIECCKGKQWCNNCEIKIRNVNFPKCPFCRKKLVGLSENTTFNSKNEFMEIKSLPFLSVRPNYFFIPELPNMPIIPQPATPVNSIERSYENNEFYQNDNFVI